MPKNRILLLVALAAIILVGFVLYQSHMPGKRLTVDPHAAEENEKARRR